MVVQSGPVNIRYDGTDILKKQCDDYPDEYVQGIILFNIFVLYVIVNTYRTYMYCSYMYSLLAPPSMLN